MNGNSTVPNLAGQRPWNWNDRRMEAVVWHDEASFAGTSDPNPATPPAGIAVHHFPIVLS